MTTYFDQMVNLPRKSGEGRMVVSRTVRRVWVDEKGRIIGIVRHQGREIAVEKRPDGMAWREC